MARPIKIEIIGDDKSIRQAFGNVDSGIGKLLKPLATMGTVVAGAFAVDRIAGFAGEIVGLATNLGNIENKVSTVFGGMADDVATWADGLNESFGVTGTQVQLLAANVADLLKPMGFSTEAATKMSQEMVGLAPALAQWSGGVYDASQVSEILAKALLGERDQLKALGISINQQEVDTRALILAKKAGREEATAMDEALATQQLIFEKSTDAQNGYTASTDTLTGQQQLLKAKFAEVKETLAKTLTPALLKVGKFLVDKVGPAFDEIKGGIKAFAGAWKAADGDVTSSGFPGLMEKLANFLRLQLIPTMTRIAKAVAPVLREVLSKTFTVLREAIEWLRKNKIFLVGFGVILAAMFGIWAVGAATAAAATLAAAAPFIVLGVAIGALAVLFKKAYEENEGFREGVDKVTDFVKNRLWPALKDVGGWIRDTLIPVIKEVAGFIADWSLKLFAVTTDTLSYLDDIYNGVKAFVTKALEIGNSITEAILGPFQRAWEELRPYLEWLGIIEGPKKAVDTIFKGGRGGREFGPGGISGLDFGPGGGGTRTFGEGGGAGAEFGGGRSSGVSTRPGPRPGTNRRPTRSFAWGGDVLAAGMFDVGERGRERVLLPQGARVQPAHTSGTRGDTYHIYAPNATPAQVAHEISWRRRIGDGR